MTIPLAHYKLNGDANSATGSHHGTADGGGYVVGKIRQGWDTEGDSRILVPTFWIGDNFTATAWINLASVIYGTNAFALAQYDNVTGQKRQWGFRLETGSALWRLITSSNGVNNGIRSFGVTAQTGWHHVALTCANLTRQWSLYIDGELENTITASYTFTDQGADFTISGQPTKLYIDGIFDDVRIYDEALPLWKIKELYNHSKGTEEVEPWQRLIQPTIQRTVQPLIGAA